MSRIEFTHICTSCGQEVQNGIMNAIEHDSVCTHDSPNENIEFKTRQMEMNAAQRHRKGIVDNALRHCTEEEWSEYFSLLLCGLRDGDRLLFGSGMMDKIIAFEDTIISKYSKIKT